MKLDENQRAILESRYLQRDETGRVIETPDDMLWRVARWVARAEAKYGASEKEVSAWAERFYALMADLDFLPNSPTLINSGRPSGQLAACFVLPIGDSIEDIFDALKYAAIIHKSGGGTGFDFSPVRPRGSLVRTTLGRASGPISFMRIFNAATEEIRQGGVRRGANMGILEVGHPDIFEFISCKDERGAFRNFNLSVSVPDRFFDAVARGRKWPLSFGGEVYREVDARQLFEEIAYHAHKTGEPGMLFVDAINRSNPTPALGEIRATNPCGEQPLLPYESCILGSVNLSNMAKPGAIDWKKLETTVRTAVRFLDDVIDVNVYPLPQIAAASLRTRKIGLGVMGWAELLFKLGIPYDSESAVGLAEEVMAFISNKAREASRELALQKGTFPAWKDSSYYPEIPLRNATLTTIAPTGSISLIAGTTPGIEPLYALIYTRKVLEDKEILVFNKTFKELLEKEVNPMVRDRVFKAICEKGSIQEVAELSPEVRAVFKTAPEIAPVWHLKMQAAFQRYTDNAVSKTINLPPNTAVEEVVEIFENAYHLGLKGVTIYRVGSREDQPLAAPYSCSSCHLAMS
ncbi:MAG: adenosylcobalamin-dependent ribonucleoside-diphosphate reductase [Thermacetogeniaceae bacterium]